MRLWVAVLAAALAVSPASGQRPEMRIEAQVGVEMPVVQVLQVEPGASRGSPAAAAVIRSNVKWVLHAYASEPGVQVRNETGELVTVGSEGVVVAEGERCGERRVTLEYRDRSESVRLELAPR